MRAAVLREFGGPEALTVGDVDTPRPGPGEVLVGVRASLRSTNSWTRGTTGKLVMDVP
ncbi:hypothetical protein [Nocardia nova]|uniref:hypothetical protein n=1 Tax=Nocardia nova TaxID=37330 RepID=UPI0015E2E920|nr:hypothetical protein [Nocardia nova]